MSVTHFGEEAKSELLELLGRQSKCVPENLLARLPDGGKAARKGTQEIVADIKSLQEGNAKTVQDMAMKYLEMRPRVVELRRMLNDALFKLLSLVDAEHSHFDPAPGRELMRRLLQQGMANKRHCDRNLLRQALKDVAALELPPRKLIRDAYGHVSKERLIDHVKDVLGRLCMTHTRHPSPTVIGELWKQHVRPLREMVLPHTNSYNYLIDRGLKRVLAEMHYDGGYFTSVLVGTARLTAFIEPESIRFGTPNMTPTEACRKHASYDIPVFGVLVATLTAFDKVVTLNVSEMMHNSTWEQRLKYNSWLLASGFAAEPAGYSTLEANLRKAAREVKSNPEDKVAHQRLKELTDALPLLWTKTGIPISLGRLPVMVGSKKCRLNGLTPKQLVQVDAEPNEHGGYFIINGTEKVLRMLVVTRGNYALALRKDHQAKHIEGGLPYTIRVRSIRSSGLSFSSSLLINQAGVVFWYFSRVSQYVIPLSFILLALRRMSPEELYDCFQARDRLAENDYDFTVSHIRAEANVNCAKQFVASHEGASWETFDWMSSLGQYFRSRQRSCMWLPGGPTIARLKPTEWPMYTDAYYGELVLRVHCLPHLNDDIPLELQTHFVEKERKFEFLLHMLHKLEDFTDGVIKEDNSDGTDLQELLCCHNIFANVICNGINKFFKPLQFSLNRQARIREDQSVRGDFAQEMEDAMRDWAQVEVLKHDPVPVHNSPDPTEDPPEGHVWRRKMLGNWLVGPGITVIKMRRHAEPSATPAEAQQPGSKAGRKRKAAEAAVEHEDYYDIRVDYASTTLEMRHRAMIQAVGVWLRRSFGPNRLDLNLFADIHRLLATGYFQPQRDRSFYITQDTGYSVALERTNVYRTLSLLRCIHRGKQIAEMRSADARKFPLEAWGFICPVESPDGAPCGVLNHLSLPCEVTTFPLNDTDSRKDYNAILAALCSFGMQRAAFVPPGERKGLVEVTLNGEVLGFIPHSILEAQKNGPLSIGTVIRSLKSPQVAAGFGLEPLPRMLEIAEIPHGKKTLSSLPLYPGLYLFTTEGRMMRPVRSLLTGHDEYIGTLEQLFLHVACTHADLEGLPAGSDPSVFQHIEISPAYILSFASSMIPFFECNPSPRNLFQCQMMKQTVAVPLLSRHRRTDKKVYQLRCPQKPLVRTEAYDKFEMDQHPIVTNVCIAVLSYTEVDMDDAVVINRGSLQRNIFGGDIFKVLRFDFEEELAEKAGIIKGMEGHSRAALERIESYIEKTSPYGTAQGAAKKKPRIATSAASNERTRNNEEYFCFFKEPNSKCATTDENGLPKRGTYLQAGVVYAECASREAQPKALEERLKEEMIAIKEGKSTEISVEAIQKSAYKYVGQPGKKYHAKESGYVDDLVIQKKRPNGDITACDVRVRLDRTPVLGDKFSSRHGQKGTMALMMEEADMPFTDSGIRPDVIINPHAFPSRMTVGMLMEVLAGKVAASDGRFMSTEATAWATLNGSTNIHDHLGQQLVTHGFNYYGEETMYSGETGEQLRGQIYTGVCSYQRLRHLVLDKWQVREKQGAIDAKTLQPIKGRKRGGGIKVGEMERDALLAHGAVNLCTDRLYSSGLTKVPVCLRCGAFVTMERRATESAGGARQETVRCTQCGHGKYRDVCLPYPFYYLCTELLAMNIEVFLKLHESKSRLTKPLPETLDINE